MTFILRSAEVFISNLCQQLNLRKQRFDDERTPKRVFSFWFFVFLLGQIGIVTSLVWAGLSGEDMTSALGKQGRSGNFLTFEISLILSCLLYYFEEYGEENVRDLFFLRVTLLVLAMLVAFLAMLNYIYINTKDLNFCWPTWFVVYNCILYVVGVLLSYMMYITFSVVEESAAEHNKSSTKAAQNMAHAMQATDIGKVGDKKVNL